MRDQKQGREMDSSKHGGRAVPRTRQSAPSEALPAAKTTAHIHREGRIAGLFRTYGGWLRRALARRYGDKADDLVQEAFLRAGRYSDDVTIRHPKALLMRIARNAAADQAGQSAERVADQSDVIELAHYVRETAQSAEQIEALVLKELILRMPEIYRDVFVLSRFHGMNYGEIADTLGLSVKTVEWRMSKALAYCAEALSGAGDT